MDRIELLSPAGDLERLKVTLSYGADAVYIGGEKYSLRANAINFTLLIFISSCCYYSIQFFSKKKGPISFDIDPVIILES